MSSLTPMIRSDDISPFRAAKQQNPNADTRASEAEIDRLVYKLYDLTYDEVQIIDPNFALSAEEYQQFSI